jgi:hypothetical protein
MIALDHLDDHPENANRMAADALAKLKLHIIRTGNYPPLIVRPSPRHADRFQILDGHHRARVLRKLGHVTAHCAVWNVTDDHHAAMLLLTLNRLHGEDDPQRRGSLLAQLRREMPVAEMAELLPECAEDIEALIRIVEPPRHVEAIAPAPEIAAMPQAITFFLCEAHVARLKRRLSCFSQDKNQALIAAMLLDEESPSSSPSEDIAQTERSRR